MEKKEDLEIDIDDIGAILKSSRLKNKKSLEDVSSELCIRKIYLQALEEGDYETLPAVPYGIGYVRTYANYLGLSSERAVKLYKASALMIEEQNKDEDQEVVPEINKVNHKHLIYGVIALLFIYVCWEIVSQASSKQVKNVPAETQVIEDVVKEKKVVEEQKEKDKKEIEQTQTANEEEVVLDVPQEPDVNKDPEKTSTAIADEKVRVVFNGESWVELKRKNKVYFQGVFHNGDVKEIDYIDNLFISVGRPKNVEIYVKGIKKNHLAKRRKTNIPVDSLE